MDAAIEVATDSRFNVTGKFYGAGVLKSHFKGVSPAPIDVREPTCTLSVQSANVLKAETSVVQVENVAAACLPSCTRAQLADCRLCDMTYERLCVGDHAICATHHLPTAPRDS